MYEAIYDRHGLRRAYDNLTMLDSIGQGLIERGELTQERSAHLDALKADQKRQIRRYYKRENERLQTRRITGGDYDGYNELIKCPEYVKTKQDAEAYFEDCERLARPNSPYDCTGKAFTWVYYTGFMRGAWYIMHCVAIDV